MKKVTNNGDLREYSLACEDNLLIYLASKESRMSVLESAKYSKFHCYLVVVTAQFVRFLAVRNNKMKHGFRSWRSLVILGHILNSIDRHLNGPKMQKEPWSSPKLFR